MGPHEPTPRRAALVRGLALGLLPVAFWYGGVASLRVVAHGHRAARVLGDVGLFTLLAGVAPLMVRVALKSKPSEGSLRQHLLGLCEQHRLRVRDVRIYRSFGRRRANAFFVGILPSRRYIYVADYLLANFSGPELDAVMAHEIGHGKERHLVVRVIVFAGAGLLSLLPYGGAVGLVVLYYLIFGLGIRLEKRADDYAVRAVGRDATVAALLHLADLNQTPLRTGRVWNAFHQHPGIAERIERIGGRVDAPPQPRRRLWLLPRTLRLAAPWRVALALVWPAAIAVLNLLGTGESPHYPSWFGWTQALPIVATLLVPFLAGLGWRIARALSVAGAVGAVALGVYDLQVRGPAAGLEITVGGAIFLLCLAAILVGRSGRGPLADRSRVFA
jgi:hypothetical protein